MITLKELDEIEAQLDSTVPYYLPRLCKALRALLSAPPPPPSATTSAEVEASAILGSVMDAFEGRPVSDFMASFAPVRLALDRTPPDCNCVTTPDGDCVSTKPCKETTGATGGRETLECPCCGDDGAESDADGLFTDGQALICGCPGWVSVDSDGEWSEAYINNGDEPCEKCEREAQP